MKHLPKEPIDSLLDQESVPLPSTIYSDGTPSAGGVSYERAADPAAIEGELSFISGVDNFGNTNATNYWRWTGNNPATYTNNGSAHKWQGGRAGSSEGLITYHFDTSSNWTSSEKQGWLSALSLWSAVANIQFVETANAASADVTFYRGVDRSAYSSLFYTPTSIGSPVLSSINPGAVIRIDTNVFGDVNSFTQFGGYGIGAVVHELGHVLGLGHGGPYNGNVDPATQQFGPMDSRLWTIASYIMPTDTRAKYYSQYPATGTSWGIAQQSFTWMPLDIRAIERLYGMPSSTPLSGGQVFGFNCNITGPLSQYFNFTIDTTPVLTLWDAGSSNTLDLSGFSAPATVNLNSGSFSSCDGLSNNIAIAFNTKIDRVIGGAGNDTFIVNHDGDIIDGGAGVNTVVFSGSSYQYSVSMQSGGIAVADAVAGRDGANSLSNIGLLRFSDLTVDVANLVTAMNIIGDETIHFIDSTAANETLVATPTTPDEFVFTEFAAGVHTIAGFNPVQDIVELSKVRFASFTDVQAATTPMAGGAMIKLGNGSSLLLPGIDPVSLHANNFALV